MHGEATKNVAATIAELPQNRRKEENTRGRIAYFALGAVNIRDEAILAPVKL